MSSPLLKSMGFLHPDKRTSPDSCSYITEIVRAMWVIVKTDLDEWKALQSEEDKPKLKEKLADDYWYQYFKMTDLTIEKNCKYPNVSKLIKAALSISHGNVNDERGFSASSTTLTWDRASMSKRTINNCQECTKSIW